MPISRRSFAPSPRRFHSFGSFLGCVLLLVISAGLVPATHAARAPHPDRQPPIDPQLTAVLNRVLDQTVASRHIPGVALAVTLPGYQTWQAARGVADRQTKVALQPTDNVRIASITKMLVATVVLQLVEEGRLALDAPIATWLPAAVPSAPTITTRHLLNHTSGLYDYLDRPFLRAVQRDPQRIWTPQALLAYAVQHRSLFTPGAPGRWVYSNTNYVLLGMLVEQVTGRTLAHEIRWRILDPIGLTQTSFAPDEAMPGTLVHGYAGTKDLTHLNMSYAWATGNIVSTVDDLGRFVHALFGGQLLQRPTLDSMYSWVDTRGALGLPYLEYGLGVMRYRLPLGRDPQGQRRPEAAASVLGHIGNLGGYRSAVWYLPASGITIAVSMNQGGANPIPVTTRVLDAILTYQDRNLAP